MHLFWRHGYEGVSLNMLTGAIGIAPPSLYATFGSKAGLFREAVARYARQFGLMPMCQDGGQSTLDTALSGFFDRAIDWITGPDGGRGCMISSGLLAAHPDNEELRDELVGLRRDMAADLEDQLRDWLSPDCAGIAASFVCMTLQGLSVQARDGASAEALRAMVDLARAGIYALARQEPAAPPISV